MAYLFKHTPLEDRFHVNLTCLIPTDDPQIPQPAQLDLKQMLRHFLDFRMEVVTRRLEYELRKLRERIHILEGFEIIFDALDRAIELIRASDGKKDAANKLMAEFDLDAVQADAVLETKLYRLAKLEIEAIREELEKKRLEALRIVELLSSEGDRWDLIKEELQQILNAPGYRDARRTEVSVPVKELDYSEEDYIVSERAWVMVTRDGWFKRQKSYSDLSTIRIRDNDEIGWVLPANTRDTVAFFSNWGRAYTMRVDDVPSTTGYGDPVQAYFDFDDGERVVGVVVNNDYVLKPMQPDQPSLVEEAQPEVDHQAVGISESGQSVRFSLDRFEEPSNVNGRMYMRLDDGDGVVNVEVCDGTEMVALASHEGRGLMFPVREVSHVKGAAKGVKAISLEGDDTVLDFALSSERLDGLEVETNQGRRTFIRRTKSKFEPTSRGNKGRYVIRRGHLIRSYRPPVEIDRGDDDEEELEEGLEFGEE